MGGCVEPVRQSSATSARGRPRLAQTDGSRRRRPNRAPACKRTPHRPGRLSRLGHISASTSVLGICPQRTPNIEVRPGRGRHRDGALRARGPAPPPPRGAHPAAEQAVPDRLGRPRARARRLQRHGLLRRDDVVDGRGLRPGPLDARRDARVLPELRRLHAPLLCRARPRDAGVAAVCEDPVPRVRCRGRQGREGAELAARGRLVLLPGRPLAQVVKEGGASLHELP